MMAAWGSARAGRERLAQHEGGTWRGAGEELMDDPHIPIPDDLDAVEDREKEDALRQDARRKKLQVALPTGRDDVNAAKGFTKHEQP